MKARLMRITVAFSLLLVLLLALPTLAFASEETEGTGIGIELFIPKPGEFFPMLVGFVVLWAILAKFGWPALTGMIDKRTQSIKESLEQAENAKIQGQQLLDEQKAELAEAKKQAAEIIAQSKQTAEAVKAEITAQAQHEAEAITSRARQAIDVEKQAAIAELQGFVADFSVAVAQKVIGSDLSDTEHRRIIERYVSEAGDFGDN
ncbi:MAG: F0F1 ATP synthase subunit B [Coriobacteriales bacterium]|jgi:F-type H+-transporting ATPase subunit b|nr:F0F1 ATP synthase subunit B [Coriobacteriales bacterium]